MNNFPGTIRYNLSSLLRFTGRDRCGTFWPYVGCIIGLGMVAWMAAIVPQFVRVFDAMQKFAIDHPDQATIDSRMGDTTITVHGYHPEFVPDFGG